MRYKDNNLLFTNSIFSYFLLFANSKWTRSQQKVPQAYIYHIIFHLLIQYSRRIPETFRSTMEWGCKSLTVNDALSNR